MATKTGVPSRSGLTAQSIDRILDARHADPFGVLGPHAFDDGGQILLAIRVFAPGAKRVSVIPSGALKNSTSKNAATNDDAKNLVEAKLLHPDGFFEAIVGPVGEDFRYRLRIERSDGHSWDCEDTYRFGRVLTDYDVYLLGEGSHYRNFEKLGAHLMTVDGVTGCHFAVWAPNAERISVVGEFNDWDGRRTPLRNLGASGLWEIFVPNVTDGDLYKLEIRARDGRVLIKSDPYAFRSQNRPETASIVHQLGKYEWKDDDWMGGGREKRNALEAPQSIYEVHLGSWMRGDGDRTLTYAELAERLVPYVKDLGFTHIEVLPIQEHPFDGSWGYQSLGYFSPTSRFGTPDDFSAFVDACHQENIGVILDWVPAHFPRDEHGLREFDGSCLYEHADPRQGEHKDWGTLIFNFGRNEVRNFLLGSALFWLEQYHLDGLRVDAVASMLYNDYSREEGEWIPNEHGGRENLEAIGFLKRLNELCHERHPGVLTIAEESTSWPGVSKPTYLGGLGFNLKWNMGWMNDVLSYIEQDPVHRKFHHQNLTFGLLYAFSENFMLPLSHDEVVHGKRSLLDKMPGDAWQKFANLRLLLAFQFVHPGKKLLFMGAEFGQGREWDFDQSLDWHLLDIDLHRGVLDFTRDLNRVYNDEAALHELDSDWKGFEWIDCHDADASTLAFLRRGKLPEDEVVAVCNFTPVVREGFRLGVPGPGFYREILNTDSEFYGGSNVGNSGGLDATPKSAHGRPWSVQMNLPPLSVIVLKR